MKKNLLFFFAFVILYSINTWGQSPFTATYTFSGTTGHVASFNYNGTTYEGISPGSFVKIGVTTSSSTNNFRATTWPTGATSGSDVFTGSIDLAKYVGFTIDAASGYKFTVSSISFGIGRSATGIRQCEWRGNADTFGSAIDNYSTLNASLTNSSGTLTNPDANSSWTANVLDLPSDYADITTSAEFRLYMFNSEASAGTAGLQGPITISGTYESAGAPIPTITVSETSLSGFSYDVGNGPSAAQTFTVSGSNLTNHITITPPTYYEISKDGVDYFLTYGAITLVMAGGTVAPTTIYARLKSGYPIGEYNNQNISITSIGATSKTLTCNGYVEGPQTTSLPYAQTFTSGFATTYTYDAGGNASWSDVGGYGWINGYPNTDGVDEDWMILPGINFSAYSNVELSFDAWYRYGNQDANNYLKLYYSTNYAGFGNPSGATWTEIPFTLPADEQSWQSTGIIDLSALTASSVYIGFKYTSNDAARLWQIDNILIQEHVVPPAVLPNAWINEIHYDNAGDDFNEMIEVVIERVDTLSLADFAITLYNGGNGASYNSKTLDTYSFGSVNGTYTILYFIYPADGIQNGSPDGISLDWKGNLIQFLSYEGTFSGVGGPADGIVSTDIGVSENNKPAGQSLQLTGTGLRYSHFAWVDPIANPGALNGGQLLAPPPPPVPVDWRYILLTFVLISVFIVYRKLR